jgi:hypothetical protein
VLFSLQKGVDYMLQKLNLTRLKGKSVSMLNDKIHKRDNYKCIINDCYNSIADGEKFHHEKRNGLKNDVEEEGLLLCYGHHQDRHFSDNSKEIKQQCIRYLKGLYPKYWEDVETDE